MSIEKKTSDGEKYLEKERREPEEFLESARQVLDEGHSYTAAKLFRLYRTLIKIRRTRAQRT